MEEAAVASGKIEEMVVVPAETQIKDKNVLAKW